MGCAKSTVLRWITRWENDGTIARKQGSGKTRGTLPGDDRYIKLVSLKDRWLTAEEIARMVTDSSGRPKVSARTIRNRLREFGLFSRKPVKKPLLTPKQRKFD